MREDSSQSQTRLSASNREELLVGYAEGVPVQELARRFNTHRATVREIARRAGHPSRAPEHSQQLRSEAAHLYAERFALSQVAAQLGIGALPFLECVDPLGELARVDEAAQDVVVEVAES